MYRKSIVNIHIEINSCRRRLLTPVVPLTGMMVIVMIIMLLVTAGKRDSHHNQQGGKTQYFLYASHMIGFALYISKNLPRGEPSKISLLKRLACGNWGLFYPETTSDKP